jgi:transposase
MSTSKELLVRERIGSFYERNKEMKTNLIVKHFALEGISKSTVLRTIKRIKDGINLKRMTGSGNWHKISDKTKQKIVEENVSEIGVSFRSIGRKHKMSDSTVKKIEIY